MPFSVIFGAGKIARGFIGHLLALAQEEFVFVEKEQKLVDLINERRQYTIRVLGAPDKDMTVRNVSALSYANKAEVSDAISRADMIFTAVGGKNITGIASMLAEGLKKRFETGNKTYANIITCENWKKPADILKTEILKLLDNKYLALFEKFIGITESVVMRSAIEANPEALAIDPLVVNVQDYWVLPVDASRVKGELPAIDGINPIQSFSGFLERKFYTYNTANGTVSYLGYLKGYKFISDAAHDEEILKILKGVYRETAGALSNKYGISFEEQMAFAQTSLDKLQNRTIVDYIERNARDPIRKLGPDDRLVGSARMVLEQGISPENIAVGIAAAIFYDEPSDPFAQELKQLREKHGIDCVIENVCKIDIKSEISALIKKKIELLKQMGWIGG